MSDGDAEPPSRSSWSKPSTWLWAACWVGLIFLVLVALSRHTDTDRPTIVFLQATTPFLYLPAYVVLVVAAIRKHFVLAGGAFAVVLIHIASVAPALGSDDPPAWAAAAPHLRIVSANVRRENTKTADAAAQLAATKADVLILVELTSRTWRELNTAGIADPFPYKSVQLYTGSGGVAILSNKPIRNTNLVDPERLGALSLEVDTGNTWMHVVAVHPSNPTHGDGSSWLHDYSALLDLRRTLTGPVVIAGDFNGGRWHRPFGRLLASGLRDANEATGRGLSASWPIDGGLVGLFGPIIRIDHALVSDDIAVLATHDVDLAGSDHRSVVVDIAVR
jgi:endonuclease/exonuclease/phosphatase (EEP) superfamily protein YafD